MDLARSVYSRDLKIAAMRALDAGSTAGEIARKYGSSPKSVIGPEAPSIQRVPYSVSGGAFGAPRISW